jgi:ABC-type transport system involved in multi-copper enzyme maturation, permease component
MSWAAIARKDAREIRDSRLLRYLLYLVVIVYALAAYVYPIDRDLVTTSEFAGFATGSVELIVPLTAILIGYNAVVGERATGQLALSLSLPQSRRTVLVGKAHWSWRRARGRTGRWTRCRCWTRRLPLW